MSDLPLTELLIVRAGDEYIRFKEEGFERCSMNKGSVFPLSQVEEAKKHCEELAKEIPGLELRKLTIREEPYTE